MLQVLRERLGGKRVVFLGIGNTLRGDDGLGSHLAARLQGKIRAVVVDGGDVPENYLGPIVDAGPEVVIMVDAAELEAPPGTVAILEAEALGGASLSTHNASPALFARLLRRLTGAQVFALAVQPGDTSFCAPMSPAVEEALEGVEAVLVEVMGSPPAI